LAATAKQITTGLALTRWNLYDEKMDPADVAAEVRPERQWWLGLPCMRANLAIEPGLTLSALRARMMYMDDRFWSRYAQGLRAAGLPE
jgi:hypothetical protein